MATRSSSLKRETYSAYIHRHTNFAILILQVDSNVNWYNSSRISCFFLLWGLPWNKRQASSSHLGGSINRGTPIYGHLHKTIHWTNKHRDSVNDLPRLDCRKLRCHRTTTVRSLGSWRASCSSAGSVPRPKGPQKGRLPIILGIKRYVYTYMCIYIYICIMYFVCVYVYSMYYVYLCIIFIMYIYIYCVLCM